MIPNRQSCPFCEFQSQKIITETNSFVFIRPLEPLVEEEILVLPKYHKQSLSLLDDACRMSVDLIWRSYLEYLHEYKLGIIYEHGNHAYHNEPWHEHAHMHLLPIAFELSAFCKPLAIKTYASDMASSKGIAQEYVFCTNERHNPHLYILEEKLQKKFLKRTCQGALDNVVLFPDKRKELCATRVTEYIVKQLKTCSNI
jgi:galactose-1-phosphate uridylyltransferase